MIIKGVVFDLDGVLIDSEPLWEQADDRLIKSFGGHGHVLSIKPKIMATREREAVKIIQEEFKLQGSVDELIAARRKFLLEIYDQGLTPRQGLFDLLHDLQKRSTHLALATANPKVIIDYVIEKLQLRPFFEALVSAAEVARGKPAPDVFLEAAKRLKLEPEACLVFEDAPNGVAAAKAAHMPCIAVLHSRNSRQTLADADVIVQELSDITPELLDRFFKS